MTDPTADTLPHELVHEHARGLRAIAHGLLADTHAADEVVQETWVAAIERPPVDAGGIGGWLRQVTRRTALKRRRGETRRSRREHEASRPESLAPTDEVVAQREVLRRVMDAVLALDEPYQTVVLMRFYQDLPPREIARRRGVKVVTVNSQIQRALKKLREHLDADGENERGHWACALAVATGWERGVPVGTTPAARPRFERWAMDWRLWMGATGAAAVLAIGTTTAEPGIEPGAGQAEVVAEAALPGAPGVQATDEGQDAQSGAAQSERRPAAPPVDPAGEETPPAAARFQLSGVVVDERDRPVPGAHVFVAPLLQPLCDLGECDAEGRFQVAWTGEAGRMRVALAIHKNGLADVGIQELEVVAGAPAEVRIATRHAAAIGYEVASLEEATAQDRAELKRHLNEFRLQAGLDERYLPRVPVVIGEDGLATFHWPAQNDAIMDHNEVDAELSMEERRRLKEELGYAGGVFVEDVTEEIVEEEGPERGTILVVDVVDAHSEPVAGVPVEVLVDGTLAYMMSTREDGSFEFEATPGAQQAELRAGGGDFGVASGVVALMAGEKPVARAHWRGVLERGNEVRGSLSGGEDAPFASWLVEFRAGGSKGYWSDTSEAVDSGFALPNLPAGRGALFLRPNLLEVLPRVVIPDVDTGVAPSAVDYELEDPGLGSLRVALADVNGDAIDDADVRIWQLASGRAVRMRYDAEERDYVRASLPAGRYRVTAGSLVNGYRNLGEVEVLVGDEASLGSAALDAAGGLKFGDFPRGSSWQLLRRAQGIETLMASEPHGLEFQGRLPAGEYTLRAVDREGEVTERELEVRAGELTQLDE